MDSTAAPQLSFADILHQYNDKKAQNPRVFSNISLADYSNELNDLTGTHLFDQGTSTGLSAAIRKGNTYLNDAVDWTGAPKFLGDIGASLGRPLGSGFESAGRSAGEGLPRTVVNLLPLLAGPEGAIPLISQGAAMAGMAGLTAADTYGQTGSVPQTALSAGTALLMPGVAHAVGGAAAGLAESPVAQAALKIGGGQLGALGLMETSHQVGRLAAGQGFDTTPEHLFGEAIGALPFAGLEAFDAVRSFRKAEADASKAYAETAAADAQARQQQAQDAVDAAMQAAWRPTYNKYIPTADEINNGVNNLFNSIKSKGQGGVEPSGDMGTYVAPKGNTAPESLFTSPDQVFDSVLNRAPAPVDTVHLNQFDPEAGNIERVPEPVLSSTGRYIPSLDEVNQGVAGLSTGQRGGAVRPPAPTMGEMGTQRVQKGATDPRDLFRQSQETLFGAPKEVMTPADLPAQPAPVRPEDFILNKPTPSRSEQPVDNTPVAAVLSANDQEIDTHLRDLNNLYQKQILPKYDLRSVVLDKLHDTTMREQIRQFMQEGYDLPTSLDRLRNRLDGTLAQMVADRNDRVAAARSAVEQNRTTANEAAGVDALRKLPPDVLAKYVKLRDQMLGNDGDPSVVDRAMAKFDPAKGDLAAFVRRAVEDAKMANVNKGSQYETVESGLSESDARNKVAELQSKAGQGETYEVKRAGDKYNVAKRTRSNVSLDYGQAGDRTNEAATPAESIYAQYLGEDSVAGHIGASIHSVDTPHEAKEVVQDHMGETVKGMFDRLTPEEVSRFGKREPGTFTQRAKLMWEAFMNGTASARSLATKEINAEMNKAGVGFGNDRGVKDWYDNTFKPFMRDWLIKQPEIQEYLENQNNARADEDAIKSTGRPTTKTRVVPAYEPGTKNSLLLSVKQWAQRFFTRRGRVGPEAEALAVTTSKIEALMRQAAVFGQAEKVRLTDLVSNDRALGTALTSMNPKWTGLVGLVNDFFPIKDAEVFFKGVLMNHEIWHTVESLYDNGQLNKSDSNIISSMREMSSSLAEADRADILRNMLFASMPKELLGQLRDNPVALDKLMGSLVDYSASDPREFMSTLAGLFGVGLSVDPTRGNFVGLKNELTYSDSTLQRFAQGFFRTASEVVQAVKSFWNIQRSGLVQYSDRNTRLETALDLFHKGFSQLARTPDEITNALKQIEQLQANHPLQYLQELKRATVPPIINIEGFDEPLKQYNILIGKTGEEDRINPFAKFWGSFTQVAEMHPLLKEIGAVAHSYSAVAREAAADILSPMFARNDNGKVVYDKGAKELRDVAASPTMAKALTKQLLFENENDRFATKDELAKLYEGLSPDQQKKVSTLRNQISQMYQLAGNKMVQYHYFGMQNDVASLLMSADKTLRSETARTLSKSIVDAAQSGTQPIFNGETTPEALTKGMQYAQSLLPGLTALKEQLSKPHYSTEQRFGQYMISYTKADGTNGLVAAKTRAEADQQRATLEKNPQVKSVRVYDKFDDSPTAGMNDKVLQSLINVENQRMQAALQYLDPEERSKFLSNYQLGESLMKEIRSRGVNKFFQKREFAEGRESLDMLQGTIDYMTSVPYSLARTFVRERARIALNDPEVKANPDVRNYGSQHIENTLAQTSQLERMSTKACFGYFIGANLPSLLVELSQPVMALPAQLMRDGESALGAYNYLGKATKTITDALRNGGKFKDQRIADMLLKAEKNGVVDLGVLDQLVHPEDLSAVNIQNAVDGSPFSSLANMVKKPANLYMQFAHALFSKAAGTSTRTIFTAAALRGLDHGMSVSDAYDYAAQTTRLTAFTGGKAARPVGLYSGKYIPRSVAGMMMALKSFTLANVGMTVRLGYDALGKSGLQGAELFNARKAFITMAGTQVLMGGALGLPGVKDVLGLIAGMFPHSQPQAWVREHVASLMGEDHEAGATLADFALKGIPTMVTGSDFSSRFGLGSILGVSDDGSFDWSGLLGAPGSIVMNAIKGVQDASTGRYGQAMQDIAPVAFKKLIQMYRGDGEFRDAKGNLLVQGTPSEKALYSLGFSPNRIAEMYDERSLLNRAEKVNQDEQFRFHDQLAQQYMAGDLQGVRQAILDRSKQDSDYSPAAGLRAVIQRVQERTIPIDLRRSGSLASAQDAMDINNTFKQTAPPVTNVDRLMQQKQLGGQFGLAGAGHIAPAEILHAAMVDKIMQENPTMSQANADWMVHQLLLRRPEYLGQ